MGSGQLHKTLKALELQSAGTWAVTVGECREQALPVVADPLTSPPETVADRAHALVDFTAHPKSHGQAMGARLARRAVERGRLNPPMSLEAGGSDC